MPRRLWAPALALALLGACAGRGGAPSDADDPIDPAPGNRSPYMVLGETYQVLASSKGYQAQGRASWYGRKFQGRPTANGERYDMYALTAAHRSLPLPTSLRVTNEANGRSVIVRVNDRGPFHDDRIVDLSYAAAQRLGFARAGTTRVKLEALPAGQPRASRDGEKTSRDGEKTSRDGEKTIPPPSQPPPAHGRSVGFQTAAGQAYWLQAGAFGEPAAAKRLKAELKTLLRSRSEARVRLSDGGRDLVRVRIGPLAELSEATRLQALLMFSDLVARPLIVRE